jgi:hypothetical protein
VSDREQGAESIRSALQGDLKPALTAAVTDGAVVFGSDVVDADHRCAFIGGLRPTRFSPRGVADPDRITRSNRNRETHRDAPVFGKRPKPRSATSTTLDSSRYDD